MMAMITKTMTMKRRRMKRKIVTKMKTRRKTKTMMNQWRTLLLLAMPIK